MNKSLRKYVWLLLMVLCANAECLLAAELSFESTPNNNCNGVSIPPSLFDLRFYRDQVHDVERSPAFPAIGKNQKITVKGAPYSSNKVALPESDWADGNYMGVVNKCKVKDLDLTNSDQRTVYTNINKSGDVKSSGIPIDDIVLVATALFDKMGIK